MAYSKQFLDTFAAFARSIGYTKSNPTMGGIYTFVRFSPFPYSHGNGTDAAFQFARRDNGSKIDAEPGRQAGWIWRSLNYKLQKANHFTRKISDRISFNVYPSKELLEILDDFVFQDKGKTIYGYKTSEDIVSWSHRHDPITMYFFDGLIGIKGPLQMKIARAVTRFARTGKIMDNSIKIGNRIYEGVYSEDEPNPERIKKLLESVKEQPELYEFIKKTATDSLVMSAGYFWICEQMAKFFNNSQLMPEQTKRQILKLATVRVMDKSTDTTGKAMYYIPNPGKEEELKKLLASVGINVREHRSKYFGQKVLKQDIGK